MISVSSKGSTIIFPSIETVSEDFVDFEYSFDCSDRIWADELGLIHELTSWCNAANIKYYFRWVFGEEDDWYKLFIENELDATAIKLRFNL